MEYIRSYGVIDIWPHTEWNGIIVLCLCVSGCEATSTIQNVSRRDGVCFNWISANYTIENRAARQGKRPKIHDWNSFSPYHYSCWIAFVHFIFASESGESVVSMEMRNVYDRNMHRKWWFINFASKFHMHHRTDIATFILMVLLL